MSDLDPLQVVLNICAPWKRAALGKVSVKVELLTFMPPPSMARMRMPRPLCPGRPTARPTSSCWPKIASALVAATLTLFLRPSTCSSDKQISNTASVVVDYRMQEAVLEMAGSAVLRTDTSCLVNTVQAPSGSQYLFPGKPGDPPQEICICQEGGPILHLEGQIAYCLQRANLDIIRAAPDQLR